MYAVPPHPNVIRTFLHLHIERTIIDYQPTSENRIDKSSIELYGKNVQRVSQVVCAMFEFSADAAGERYEGKQSTATPTVLQPVGVSVVRNVHI